MHSVYSDGRESPAELLARARGWLHLVSICDHDTIGAYLALERAGQEQGETSLRILPGIEISARLTRERDLHLLGYFPRGFPQRFREFVAELESARRQRVRAGIRTLRERGVPLRWAHVEEQIGCGVPCRSHVARALQAGGLARNPRVIFDRYLSRGAFGRPPIEAGEAIDAVRRAGGIAVWAHPPPVLAEEHVARLRDQGLEGLEAFLPSRSSRDRRRVADLAEANGLFTTGGSDHHGGDPRRPLGSWRFALERVPSVLRMEDDGDGAATSEA